MGKVKEYEEVLNNLVDEANKLEASDCFEDQVRARGMFNVINKLELARGNNVRQGVTDAEKRTALINRALEVMYRDDDPKYLKSNRDFLCTIDNEELQRRIDYHQ